MKCNECQSEDTKVIESRDVNDAEAIRRRRMCLQCSNRFTTYERIERPQLVVVKNDGIRELFNRQKLLSGLLRASEKTTLNTMELERLVSQIERELHACGETEVTTARIGDMVMKRLARLDEVAYVRFASVYRRFTDIAGFEQQLFEIKQIKQRKTDDGQNQDDQHHKDHEPDYQNSQKVTEKIKKEEDMKRRQTLVADSP